MSDEIDLPLTPDDVASIVSLLDGSGYQGLELSTPRFVLKVARAEGGGWTQEWRHPIPAERPIAVLPAEPMAAMEVEGLVAIRPPLPGTFYHTPQPGAPPFVKVGAIVSPDTIIGIIETMKVMNSIPAGASGEIVEITAGHGDMVDQSAVLMRLRPMGQSK
jgi:acetyl-CoA carboxylase biotin carboxyl carrier protein